MNETCSERRYVNILHRPDQNNLCTFNYKIPMYIIYKIDKYLITSFVANKKFFNNFLVFLQESMT